MRTLVIAALLSLGITALLTPLVWRTAMRLGFFDAPDGDRKIHTRPIPRLGGIAIAAGVFAPLIGLLIYNNYYSLCLASEPARFAAFFVGAAAILGLGLYDDVVGANAWKKLLVQVSVGTVLYFGGLQFSGFSLLGYQVELGLWALPFTIIWVVAIINAMNLIDGLDGLAAGVAFIAAATLFATSVMDDNYLLALFAAAIGGSMLGFLFYNFAPALIFMGDAGSLFVGYVFAVASLWTTAKTTTLIATLVPMLALGLPLTDTAFAFARRIVAHRSPFTSDRQHLHHRLLAAGYNQRQAVLILYGICVCLALGALVLKENQDPAFAAVLVAVGVVIFAAFHTAGARTRVRMSGIGETTITPEQRVELRRRILALRGAQDPEQVWARLCEVCDLLPVSGVSLRLFMRTPAEQASQLEFTRRRPGNVDPQEDLVEPLVSSEFILGEISVSCAATARPFVQSVFFLVAETTAEGVELNILSAARDAFTVARIAPWAGAPRRNA